MVSKFNREKCVIKLLKFSEAFCITCTYIVNFNISSKMGFTSEVYTVHLFSLETNI